MATSIEKELDLIFGKRPTTNEDIPVHYMMPAKMQWLMLFFWAVFMGGPLIIHLLDPCIMYTNVIRWVSTGTYIGVFVFVGLVTLLYNKYILFCTKQQRSNHYAMEPALFCFFGSTLCFYDVYAYYGNNAWWGFLVMGCIILAAGYYFPCYLEHHMRICSLYRQSHHVMAVGRCGENIKATLDVFVYVIWLSMFGILAMYNWEFKALERPADTCLPILN